MKLYQLLQQIPPETPIKIGTTHGGAFFWCGSRKEWDGSAMDDFFSVAALTKLRKLKKKGRYNTVIKYENYLNDYVFLNFRNVAQCYKSLCQGLIIILEGLEVGPFWDAAEVTPKMPFVLGRRDYNLGNVIYTPKGQKTT